MQGPQVNRQRGIFGLSLATGVVYAVAAVAIVAFLTGIYIAIERKGYERGKLLLTEYQQSQTAATVETIRVVEKIVTDVQTVYVDRIRVRKEKGDVIVQKVPEYIMVVDDAACELRAGFVRVHDSAARNEPPQPPADSDRAPGGVALSEATAVVAENYSTCHRWREQVLGWQEFWTRYSGALEGAVCLPK